uniref:Magnesium transporter n=2 Tax=Tetraselmis sp. GSL018 TaxID=582737 RepID=A0A061S5Y0_9CHLO|mmetsp:Transcript_33433/g.79279  ORF Transcript_33433/g.79279 Transcript_33433/m.79279 type:complete len:202 (+) Transcript_33433:456-1061(+)
MQLKIEGDKDSRGFEDSETAYDYRHEGVLQCVASRLGWLVFFFCGLMLAAVVVEAFEEVLKKEVELSYFVPLLIGHGGNTGSQAVATMIRALALGQVGMQDLFMVVAKEGAAGVIMGTLLGLCILAFSFVWSGITPAVGLTVAVALPVVSLWANVLGAALPILSARLGYNPAVTSAPLMTTIVDSTGLIIYFYIAKWILQL